MKVAKIAAAPMLRMIGMRLPSSAQAKPPIDSRTIAIRMSDGTEPVAAKPAISDEQDHEDRQRDDADPGIDDFPPASRPKRRGRRPIRLRAWNRCRTGHFHPPGCMRLLMFCSASPRTRSASNRPASHPASLAHRQWLSRIATAVVSTEPQGQWRDLLSTISGLSLREGLSTPRFAPPVETTGILPYAIVLHGQGSIAVTASDRPARSPSTRGHGSSR